MVDSCGRTATCELRSKQLFYAKEDVLTLTLLFRIAKSVHYMVPKL